MFSTSQSFMTNQRMFNRLTKTDPNVILYAKRRTTLSRAKSSAPKENESAENIEKLEIAEALPSRSSNELISIRSITAAATTQEEDEPVTSVQSAPSNKGRQLSQRIQDDISDFERIGLLKEKKVIVEEGGVSKTLKNVFSALFIADFFVVIVFLVWFLAAAAMQSTNPFLLEKFQVIPCFCHIAQKYHTYLSFVYYLSYIIPCIISLIFLLK